MADAFALGVKTGINCDAVGCAVLADLLLNRCDELVKANAAQEDRISKLESMISFILEYQ